MPRVHISADVAVQLMRDAGYEPSESYPGQKARPWLVRCLACKDERRRYLHLIIKGSRCIVCAGKAPLSHEAAAEVMRAAGFEPLDAYVSAGKPWATRCTVCGLVKGRQLRAVRSGAGCSGCAGNERIEDSAARAVFLEAGFEPLEPFPGAAAGWLARCLTCRSEKKRYYGHVRTGGGCGDCKGNVKYTHVQAVAFMREVGMEPLDPYVGSNEPWRSRCTTCGTVGRPALSSIRQGRGGCDPCARGKRRIPHDEAVTLMRDHGFEPEGDFPGSDQPWPCRCLTCGSVRDRIYTETRQGVGCPTCSGRDRVDPDHAETVMLAANLRPLESFDTVGTKWACECLGCGRTVHPRYNHIRAGFGGCARCAGNARLDDDEAAAFMRENGWEPLVPYPGANSPWPSRCLAKGHERQPSLGTVKRNSGCGACWAESRRNDADQAAAVMLANGLEPLVPYPGSNKDWLCGCVTCGSNVEPTYTFVRRGQAGCMPCRWSLDRPGRSAGLYVMVHEGLGAVKVGIGVVVHGRSGRVAQHQARGWVSMAEWSGLRDWRVVQGVEARVLSSWRARGLAGHVRPGDMPQGGWSETAPVGRVNVDDLVGWVTCLIGDVADEVARRDEAVGDCSAEVA